MEQETFTSWLKSFMKDKKISQMEVSRVTGVHPSTVSQWLNRGSTPHRFILLRVRRRLKSRFGDREMAETTGQAGKKAPKIQGNHHAD